MFDWLNCNVNENYFISKHWVKNDLKNENLVFTDVGALLKQILFEKKKFVRVNTINFVKID